MCVNGGEQRHAASSSRNESAHYKYDVKLFVFVSNITTKARSSPQACEEMKLSPTGRKNTADLQQKQIKRRNSAGVYLAGKELH